MKGVDKLNFASKSKGVHTHYTAVEDKTFLGMQDFDFCLTIRQSFEATPSLRYLINVVCSHFHIQVVYFYKHNNIAQKDVIKKGQSTGRLRSPRRPARSNFNFHRRVGEGTKFLRYYITNDVIGNVKGTYKNGVTNFVYLFVRII